MALMIGLKLHKNWNRHIPSQKELENNADKDGTIISTLPSIKNHGIINSKLCSLNFINPMAIDGKNYHVFS